MIFLLIERVEKPSLSVILFTDADNIGIRRDGLTDLADGPRILVYTDGAARGNPGPAAIGYAIFDPDGNCIEQDGRYIGPHTNNEAEYEALLWALGAASKHTNHNVKFHSDSELIVYQVNGVYRVKKDHLREYVERIRKATEAFDAFKLVHVPRENPNIQKVDDLVNRVLDERDR